MAAPPWAETLMPTITLENYRNMFKLRQIPMAAASRPSFNPRYDQPPEAWTAA
jgi:hypothetical protein